MTADMFEYNRRRSRQHQLFALNAVSSCLRRSHKQLAAAYRAAASFAHRDAGARRPA
jgi:hypothetical protein